MTPARSARRLVAAAATIAISLLLASCSGSGSGADPSSLTVVASTDVWGDIARTVAGPHVEVTSFITDPSQDPHSFEVTTSDLLAVSRAGLVIENGGGYDDFVARLIASSKTKATVLDAVAVSGKRAPAGGQLNEHVWYDLPTVQRMAGAVAAALGKERPADAAAFTRRADALSGRIARLVRKEAAIRRQVGGARIGVTEPVPLYLTEACGLTNATPAAFSQAIEEGDDLSPQVLNETLDLFSRAQVDALVYNEQTSGAATARVEAAARASRIPVVPVAETLPAGLTYVPWMQQNLTRLEDALTRS
jgi:zinc/manganese transport system substrate-binding protein